MSYLVCENPGTDRNKYIERHTIVFLYTNILMKATTCFVRILQFIHFFAFRKQKSVKIASSYGILRINTQNVIEKQAKLRKYWTL